MKGKLKGGPVCQSDIFKALVQKEYSTLHQEKETTDRGDIKG